MADYSAPRRPSIGAPWLGAAAPPDSRSDPSWRCAAPSLSWRVSTFSGAVGTAFQLLTLWFGPLALLADRGIAITPTAQLLRATSAETRPWQRGQLCAQMSAEWWTLALKRGGQHDPHPLPHRHHPPASVAARVGGHPRLVDRHAPEALGRPRSIRDANPRRGHDLRRARGHG